MNAPLEYTPIDEKKTTSNKGLLNVSSLTVPGTFEESEQPTSEMSFNYVGSGPSWKFKP